MSETEHNNGESEQPMEQEETCPQPHVRTEQFEKIAAAGIHESVCEELDKLFASGVLVDGDLDQRALEAMKEFDLEGAKKVIEDFSNSKLEHVANKSAYLCGVMKVQRKCSHVKSEDSQKGPDEAKINALLERTGYALDITTGQRKYGGPPPTWGDKQQPGTGCEVFVGHIPREMFEDELVPLFEIAGEIWDLRIMMDPSTKLNRGYGFVSFCDKEAAKAAVEKVDGKEVKPGLKLKVCVSIPNVRLFVGNIPKSKSKEEITEEFSKLVDDLQDVIIYCDHNDERRKNRGFAFLDFISHKAAATARRKLMSGRIKVWNLDILTDWADPQTEPDEETMAKVKVLYVNKLSSDVTEEMLRTKFEPYGKVERVRKLANKAYGFVHFEDRENALSAMADLNGQKLGSNEMIVTLAKPQVEQSQKNRKPRRGRGFDFGGGSFGRGGGAFGGFGGYDNFYPPMDYGGGYGYGDYGYGGYGGFGGYDDYYRGRGRGGGPRGNRGMGGPRGMGGGPRGGMMRGGRGGGMRGGRGGPRGGGMSRGGAGGMRAGKRKFGGDNQQQAKRRPTSDQSWGSQPIPQQPMEGGYGGNNDASQWYQDSYNAGSW